MCDKFHFTWLQNRCVQDGSNLYTGQFNATTHVIVGGGGAMLSPFRATVPYWSFFRDYDFGFSKLTALNHSTLLFEYKKSRDGKVYDHFTISRDYRDIMACSIDNCPRTTLAVWTASTSSLSLSLWSVSMCWSIYAKHCTVWHWII